MVEDPKVEELALAMVGTVLATSEDDQDTHRANVYRLTKELPRPKRQRAIRLGRAMLAEEHAIERAELYLDR
jgi:hypothetical protein